MSSLKIALAQSNIIIGDFPQIREIIHKQTQLALTQGASLLIFPELFISGWPLYDRVKQPEFLTQVNKVIEECLNYSNSLAILLGAPVLMNDKLYNASILLKNGERHIVSLRNHFHSEDFYHQSEYFEPGNISDVRVFEIQGKKFVACLGDDVFEFALSHQFWDIDLLIVQSCVPYVFRESEHRRERLRYIVEKLNVPLIFVQQVGAQTGCIFDGGSVAISLNGKFRLALKEFEEDIGIVDLEQLIGNTGSFIVFEDTEPEGKVARALVTGIRDFVHKNGFHSALVGLSGGIDSALVAVLAVEALGNNNVHALYLPSRFSSQESLEDAQQLAHHLNISFRIVSIDETYKLIVDNLSPYFQGLSFDITEENIQSRLRAVYLMAFANKFGYVLLNTSNKSEVATGYGTLYGDVTGALSVLGDIYKTQVYQIARYFNRRKPVIPERIFTKAPSAELKDNQKDSDTLPDYALLDTILYHYLEQQRSRQEIYQLVDAPADLIDKVIFMVEQSEFKRQQAPPILHVSSCPFGIKRKVPITERKDFFKI